MRCQYTHTQSTLGHNIMHVRSIIHKITPYNYNDERCDLMSPLSIIGMQYIHTWHCAIYTYVQPKADCGMYYNIMIVPGIHTCMHRYVTTGWNIVQLYMAFVVQLSARYCSNTSGHTCASVPRVKIAASVNNYHNIDSWRTKLHDIMINIVKVHFHDVQIYSYLDIHCSARDVNVCICADCHWKQHKLMNMHF